MKNKINPFVYRLIKSNIFYLVAAVVLFVLIIAEIRIGSDQSAVTSVKLNAYRSDVAKLETKAKLLTNIVPSTEKLDEDIKLLNMLVPNIEDYFSIAYALEKLSERTNFIIIGYNVNIKQSNSNKLRLTVNGMGDPKSFINFLSDYNFAGGRLITSDKIELNPQEVGVIRIELTFYNKSAQGSENLSLPSNTSIFSDLENLKQKLSFDFESEDTKIEEGYEYPRKENPF